MLSRPDFAPLLHPTAAPEGVPPIAHAVASLAAANGWEYFTHAVAQPLPGLIFRREGGQPRFMQLSTNVVRIPGDPSIEVGNSFYLENAGGNQFPQNWGYATADTGQALPPVVLEAERSRKISALPAVPADAEPRGLGEPGFEFTLYAAPAAAAWAAEVFSPDLVALLDDGIFAFDVELAGGYVFLYSPGELATPAAALWERVLTVLPAVVGRIQAVPAPVPAPTAHPSAPARTVMRARHWAVNGRRYLWQWGILAAGLLVTAGVFARYPR